MRRAIVLSVTSSIVQGITAILAIEVTVGLLGLSRRERSPL